MSTHKHIDLICAAVTVLTLLITVLFIHGEALGIQVVVDQDAEINSGKQWFTENDKDGTWNTSAATVITLGGAAARVEGGGAYAYDGGVVISSAGRYVLSGALTDGKITVDADSGAKVWILFDGVDVFCADDACLRVDQADKVFLTLAEGTENRLSSGAAYSQEALEGNTDGAVFAHDDLTINGGGSLTVDAGYKHGIAVNDCLVITGGTIAVTAPQDALHANDSIRLREAHVTVNAGDDGVSVDGGDSAAGENTGYYYMESGTLDVTSAQDGIKAVGEVTVAGGGVTVDAGDDGVRSESAVNISGGAVTLKRCYEGIEAPFITVSGGDVAVYPTDDGFNASGGGVLFPGGATDGTDLPRITVSGGTVTVVNASGQDADGLDSNGDILITGGDVRVSLHGGGTNSALDYGSENGGVCAVSGGTVVACGSYAMAEGFDDSSAQCSVLWNISTGVPDGAEFTLADSRGKVLLSYAAPCGFTSVALSTPELTLGETYTLAAGDVSEEITLEDISAAYGDVQSGAFFGPMGRGGGRGFGGRGDAGPGAEGFGGPGGEPGDLSALPSPGRQFPGETPPGGGPTEAP